MGYNDYGFRQLGSFIKGDNPSNPSYMEFGVGSTAFTGSTAYLEDGIIRKELTWFWAGSNIRANTSLLTTDANGSNIQELGLVSGSVVAGSDAHTRDTSAIGDKTASFTVDVGYEIRFSRS